MGSHSVTCQPTQANAPRKGREGKEKGGEGEEKERKGDGEGERKVIKIVAKRRHVLKLKCTKFDFGWGSARPPNWI